MIFYISPSAFYQLYLLENTKYERNFICSKFWYYVRGVTDISENCLHSFTRKFICILCTWWQNIWNVEPVCFHFLFSFLTKTRWWKWRKKSSGIIRDGSFFICLKHSLKCDVCYLFGLTRWPARKGAEGRLVWK